MEAEEDVSVSMKYIARDSRPITRVHSSAESHGSVINDL